MNLHRSLLVASVIAATGLAAAPVSSARAAETLQGNPVPGVCLLSREAIFAQAKVGQAASKRLNELAVQARAKLVDERKPLDADIRSFQQKAPSLSEAQRKKEGSALQQRMQSFQGEAGALNERVQLTRAEAMRMIGKDAESVIASSYKSHHCGLLLNRNTVLAGNMSNDLTAEVVQGLDRKVTTISFDLQPLPSAKKK
jgi:Skp family chaperone for outer membrane proteins